MKKVISLIALLALLLCLTGCPPLNKDDPPVTGELKVHFIDVGQADAAIILCAVLLGILKFSLLPRL